MIELPFEEDRPKYTYKFVIDGKRWEVNKDKPKERDSNGNENNYFTSKT